jgi:hypothetical protein
MLHTSFMIRRVSLCFDALKARHSSMAVAPVRNMAYGEDSWLLDLQLAPACVLLLLFVGLLVLQQLTA